MKAPLKDWKILVAKLEPIPFDDGRPEFIPMEPEEEDAFWRVMTRPFHLDAEDSFLIGEEGTK